MNHDAVILNGIECQCRGRGMFYFAISPTSWLNVRPRNETLQPGDFLVLGQNNGTRQSCLSNVQKESIAENAP